MYSDILESPSKDCFSFNDQSTPYDMAEVNEISNQTNLDYIIDSYYSSVSRYNTDFELPEDCINMSFSELFDQELFSTHENKDCQITIKIEKEEPLNECYSEDNSIDTKGGPNFVKAGENIPPLSLSKSFAPKRGINRTFIKTRRISDVEHLIHNPFCETEQVNNPMLGNINTSIVKCEPEDINDNIEEKLVEMEVYPHYSVDVLQNHTDLEKSKEYVVSSSSLKSSTQNRLGINRIPIKTSDKCDVNHLDNASCESKNQYDDQIPVNVQTPIIKCEPENINDNIEENLVEMEVYPHHSAEDLEKSEEYVVSSSSLKISTPKRLGIDRIPIKSSDKYDVNHLDNASCKSKNQCDDQIPVEVQTPIIKYKPIDNNDTFDETTVDLHFSAEDSQTTSNSHNMVKVKNSASKYGLQSTTSSHNVVKVINNVTPLLLKKSTPKYQGINKMPLKTTSNVKHPVYSKSKHLGTNQMSVNVQTPIVKFEPENINDNIEENLVEMKVFSHYSVEDLEKNREYIVSSWPLKRSTPKRQGINRIPIKTSDKCDVNHLDNASCEPKDQCVDQISVEVQTPIIKCKPIDNNATFDETIVDLHFSAEDPQTTSNSHNMMKVKNSASKYGLQSTTSSHNVVKVINNVTPLLLKKSTPKYQGINKMPLKTTSNVKHPVYGKSKHLGTNQMSVNVQTPIVKFEPENNNMNDSIEKPIVKKEMKPCYSANQLNCTSNILKFVKTEQKVSPLLIKNSTVKRRANNKKPIKATENCVVKHIAHNLHCEQKKIGNDQISVKLTTPAIKCEPEDFNGTSKENIEMVINPYYSSSYGLQSTAESQRFLKIDEVVSSSKSFASQYQGANNSSIITSDNSDIKNDLIYKPKDLGNDLVSVKREIPIISREPKNNKSTIQPNVMEINLKSEKEKKCVDLNEIHSADIINGNAKSHKVIIKKRKTIVSSIKTGDIDSQTDKKKISWEEFRAKREKMGLINISEIKEEPATDIVATDNVKMKAMKEEFDRNTAEHFAGQKRKMDDREEPTTTAKEINNEEEELQKKWMKIEYIKKLLPSSFASEIAKTSGLMKGSLVEDNDNESTSDDSMLSNDKTQGKYSNTHDKTKKKGHQTKVHLSHRNSSRSDYNNKSSGSSSTSSNTDDYYNRNKTDAPSQGASYSQNPRTTLQRPKDQKRVVYVGQIPIRLGKRYLYNRFKEFGTIQSLTLHKKPEFRVYYAFVTYSENSEADRAISHGNDDGSQVQLDIRFGERKQTQTPYYDLDDEWLTDWYRYKQPIAPVVKAQTLEKASFEEELQEFYKLAQIKKSNQIKPSQVS